MKKLLLFLTLLTTLLGWTPSRALAEVAVISHQAPAAPVVRPVVERVVILRRHHRHHRRWVRRRRHHRHHRHHRRHHKG